MGPVPERIDESIIGQRIHQAAMPAFRFRSLGDGQREHRAAIALHESHPAGQTGGFSTTPLLIPQILKIF
jgi:hypothetical protein